MPLTGIELEAFCWPTEDVKNVKAALAAIAPEKPAITRVKGQSGEKIEILRVRVKKQKEIDGVVGKLKPVREEMDDEGRIIVHYDKQKAFEGKIERGKGIKVTLKFAAHPFDLEKLKQEAGELIG